MNTPLVSVCLITYNHSKYIRQTLESILMQQVSFDWELVVADDYSIDGTREIILEYKEKFPELIKLILQESNVGASKNWIDLIKFPNSKYIAYTEGDDYWTDPDKLQKQVDFMESHDNYSLFFHNVLKYHESRSEFEPFNNMNIKSFDPSLDDIIRLRVGVPSCSWLFRREKLFIPAWISDCAMGDWPILLFLGSVGKFRYSSDIMGVYRKHSSGASIMIKNGIMELIKILRLFLIDVPKLSKVISPNISRLYLDAAMKEKFNSKGSLKFVSYGLRSVFYHPSSLVTYWKAFVLLFLPRPIGASLRKRQN